MGPVQLHLAVGGQHQHPLGAELAKGVVQEGQGAVIRPVEVVQEQQEPALPRQGLQEPRRVVEQPEPLLGRREGRRRGEGTQAGFQFGGELGQHRRGLPRDRAQHLRGRGVNPAADGFDEGEVRRGGLELVAPPAQDRGAGEARLDRQLPGQPGLPRPRLPGEEDHAPLSLQGPSPGVAEPGQLGGAADQPAPDEPLDEDGGSADPHLGDLRRNQRLVQLRRARVTPVRLLGQELQDHGFEAGGDRRVVGPGRHHRCVKVLRDDGEDVFPGEGGPPGQQLVEHHPEGVEIGPPVHRLAQGLLGGDVGRGAHDRPLLGEARGAPAPGHPEVAQLDRPGAVGRGLHPEHVLRLHVAMDDVVVVGVAEGPGELPPDLDDPRGGKGPRLAEALPRHQLHDDEGNAPLLAHVVDGHDVGVVQGGGGAGLLEEPGLALRPAGDREHLDRHLALELGVEPEVDRSHPAPAEEPVEPVTAVEDRALTQLGRRGRDLGGAVRRCEGVALGVRHGAIVPWGRGGRNRGPPRRERRSGRSANPG